jgi:hypothetical protein
MNNSVSLTVAFCKNVSANDVLFYKTFQLTSRANGNDVFPLDTN